MSETTSPTIQFMTRDEYEALQSQIEGRLESLDEEGLPVAKKEFKRERVAKAFDQAFDLIGGVPRLALWANRNETEFYKLYGRMLPTGTQVDLNATGEIIFRHVLPPSKLDKLENQNGGHSREG